MREHIIIHHTLVVILSYYQDDYFIVAEGIQVAFVDVVLIELVKHLYHPISDSSILTII